MPKLQKLKKISIPKKSSSLKRKQSKPKKVKSKTTKPVKSKTIKSCSSKQIRNPSTNRCVNKTSKIGKLLSDSPKYEQKRVTITFKPMLYLDDLKVTSILPSQYFGMLAKFYKKIVFSQFEKTVQPTVFFYGDFFLIEYSIQSGVHRKDDKIKKQICEPKFPIRIKGHYGHIIAEHILYKKAA